MILQKILEWSETLPDWQSDALGQLLSKPELQDQDVERLYALLKAEHGIPDSEGRMPIRLSAQQVPVAAPADLRVELLELKGLRRVNAIAEDQGIAFASSGLTVVYGDNGSGKSGYSRVLKRACRARDQAEPIHPDARKSGDRDKRAEATIAYSVDGQTHSTHWVDGEPAEDDLSCISIFDARCARAYLDQEDDFSYIPYGLDVLERLANLCRQLESKVRLELERLSVDLSAFDHLVTDTKVGGLISGLSSNTDNTDVAAIQNLGTLTAADESRLDELTHGLTEGDPKAKAHELELRATRLERVATAATAALCDIGEAESTRLAKSDVSVCDAEAAAEAAAASFESGGGLLPGTGGEAWKSLFEAARAFSLESHPENTFPDLDKGSPCPLCQQPLQEGVERLRRFDVFVHQKAGRALAECREKRRVAHEDFRSRSVLSIASEETVTEIETIDESLAARVRFFQSALAARCSSIHVAMESGDWSLLEPVPEAVSQDLIGAAKSLRRQALTFAAIADDVTRGRLSQERAELVARRDLGKVKGAVLAAIERLALRDRLETCSKSLNTRSISNKSKGIAEAVVSSELAEALNHEFEVLGVDDLHVVLSSRTERGRVLHKLVLEVPGVANPGAILSEGEQRAIAIGSFLAEVVLSGGRAGILFDDPVSSLDHRRRERVAKRLVDEAKRRQVVVLTHDIYFLCILVDEASRASVPILPQSLVRRPEGFGVAVPDLPFQGKKTSARVGELRQLQQKIDKLKREGDNLECERLTVEAYQKLRLAWERGVEEVLFREVVLRFRKGVETQRLRGVVVEDKDYRQVEAGMAKCSDYAHDRALEGCVSLPSPSELLQDIERLESWRAESESRATQTQKRRKESGGAAPAAQEIQLD